MASYDLIVIGSGPGGYVCAIRAAQLGMKVACVEGRETLGGTCLNVGCIPSKALLHASHMLHEAHANFAKMGIRSGDETSADWDQMLAYKDESVKGNTQGIEFLFKKNKIDWIRGWATIPEKGKVRVGDEEHEAKNIVIATGSEVAPLKGVEVDGTVVVDSSSILSLPRIPKEMVVIGAGVIGLELGSVFNRLGSKVTVIEYLDHITPGMDGEIQRGFLKILKKQGLDFVFGAAVQEASVEGDTATVRYLNRKDDSEQTITADTVLLATGRRPFSDGLGLADLGVEMTERGQVRTDHYATNVEGIWAIGDVTAGPMLAHKAEDEGIAVAEILAGQKGHVNYDVIPAVIYTHPEVAAVGLTEEALKESGRAYKVGKFNFMGNARAKAVLEAQGFVKILADKETDRVLGCHLIGPAAGDLIHEICVAMEFGAAAEDVARTCHAHPTFSEAVREAALALGDGPIHS
ncbi:dihydrolipoyl dehydrogenase [Wenxinia saemankumensis]|uniref:Dihydrolipoyl dehydrogenase n=1 Tax=Wenxinia saemankumensis TaxID=1447782 RepID=A0A1M6ELZ4_9RHOB|nr:dihydrolipoyl dehydrogenase [Wenxinia saemankumensis]SHI86493.1 dihydrolipoamide dehydrogenase [Wenxinia saemankumensis]